MRSYICDVETDGLLPPVQPDKTEATQVHCIVLRNGAGVTKVFIDPEKAKQAEWKPDGTIQDALDVLAKADEITAHNGQDFDVPVLRYLYPGWDTKARVFDTLVVSRLIWPDIAPYDFRRYNKGFPRNLTGRHSLEAWGERIGVKKDDFGHDADWSKISHAMVRYCIRDVEVCGKLSERQRHRLRKKWPEGGERALVLEHGFAGFIQRMMRRGIYYDLDAHQELHRTLCLKRKQLGQVLRDAIPPFNDDYTTPKKKIFKEKRTPFNPNSRDHIARFFKEKYGWEPEKFTDGGKPQVDEAVLSAEPCASYEETPTIAEYLFVQKRLGQIAEGPQAYIKHVDAEDQRLRGYVNHNGCVTARCSHSRPNTANAPAVGKPWGEEVRKCWSAPPGWWMVGVDAKGIEFRGLSHYLAPYDGGKLIEVVLEGDVHWHNAQALLQALGHPEFIGAEYDPENALMKKMRDFAKTFIYAYLYGAGPEKLGSIVKPKAKKKAKTSLGYKLGASFEKGMPAVAKMKRNLLAAIEARGGKLKALDGRLLDVRSDHSALNTLLQSFGAITVKWASVAMEQRAGKVMVYGEDFAPVIHCHDEVQTEVRGPERDRADSFGEIGVQAIRDAGNEFDVRCPLDGSVAVGRNWAETH